MDLGRLFKRGKKVVDDRGGVEALKEDATELKDVATKQDGLGEKAKDVAAAIKEPGAPGGAK